MESKQFPSIRFDKFEGITKENTLSMIRGPPDSKKPISQQIEQIIAENKRRK